MGIHSHEKIGLAISGGIDSLVSGYLLKEQGYDVLGFHFLTGYESSHRYSGGFSKNQTDPIQIAQNKLSGIVERLDIPLEVVDVSSEFEQLIVRYFTDTYRKGRTPNPCLVCNPSIKFGLILSQAIDLGASHLATGHYARIVEDSNGRCHLLRGNDRRKDQSYFLALLTQEQLSKAVFPLGPWTKDKVRRLASEKSLTPVMGEESQDVCFIKNGSYSEFLRNQKAVAPSPGLIEDLHGNILGEHQGLHLFTVGQRRGINCPASEPYYVIRLDREQNRLIVGFKKDTLCSNFRVERINWICPPNNIKMGVHTRVRYRHRAAPSEIVMEGEASAKVRFEHPQSAVTPGQGAVFYRGEEVLGGGFIVDTVSPNIA